MEEYSQSEGRGRSAQKREARAVEELAWRLAELPAAEFARLPRFAELEKELNLARSIEGHGSRKRQIKHLAGVLRRHDEQREQLVAALDGQALELRRETLAFHHLEALRDRLCDPQSFAAAMNEVRAAYPLIDHAKLARLASSVHEHADKRAAREIFRRLRQAAQDDTD